MKARETKLEWKSRGNIFTLFSGIFNEMINKNIKGNGYEIKVGRVKTDCRNCT